MGDNVLIMQIAILLSVLAAASARTTSDKLDNTYSFEKFVQEHGLKFSESEISEKRTLFATELARVLAHNSKENLGWKEGMNKFSLMSKAGT